MDSSLLNSFPNLIHSFPTKHESNPLPNLKTVHQVHGNTIVIIDNPNQNVTDIQADGLITILPNIALGIKTADCLPVFIFDRDQNIIGAIHAGWRGTVQRITEKMIQLLISKFNSNPSSLFIAMGPCIESCCFEVGDEVIAEFAKQFSPNSGVYIQNKTHYIDIKMANQLQCQENNIPIENIDQIPYCTFCRDDLFYSYRRGKEKEDRHLNSIMLKETK